MEAGFFSSGSGLEYGMREKNNEDVKRSNCPFCGKTMEMGDLSDSGYKMKWRSLPNKGAELGFLDKLRGMDIDPLGTEGGDSHLKGYRCKNCKKLILSYGDER
jgi:hypothetical protein